jgi:hypothetical protein
LDPGRCDQCCLRTSVTIYQPSPHNIAKEQRPQLHDSRSLKSYIIVHLLCMLCYIPEYRYLFWKLLIIVLKIVLSFILLADVWIYHLNICWISHDFGSSNSSHVLLCVGITDASDSEAVSATCWWYGLGCVLVLLSAENENKLTALSVWSLVMTVWHCETLTIIPVLYCLQVLDFRMSDIRWTAL